MFMSASYQTGFENYFSVVTMLSQVLGLALSIRFLEKYPLKYCVLAPVALSVLVMLTSVRQHVLFAVTLVSCALFGLNSAISGGGIFGLSGCLPPEYTGAVMRGQGLGGVVVSLASILTIYLSPVQGYCSTHQRENREEEGGGGECAVSVDYSAFFFFATCCGVLLLCFGTFFALLVLPFTR
jgi:hypothetical protein